MERCENLLLSRISWLIDTSEAFSFPRGKNFVFVNKNNETTLLIHETVMSADAQP
jgi:hypothetical protein